MKTVYHDLAILVGGPAGLSAADVRGAPLVLKAAVAGNAATAAKSSKHYSQNVKS